MYESVDTMIQGPKIYKISKSDGQQLAQEASNGVQMTEGMRARTSGLAP